ncbi:hypothetical protein U1Q18_007077 [Sarracenia purpurea var. burkii]
MPPEVSPSHPLPPPTIQSLPRELPPPRSPADNPPTHKHYQGSKKIILEKKPILILVFILSGISVLRLLKISIITSFSPPPSAALPPTHTQRCSSPPPACKKIPPQMQGPSKSQPVSSSTGGDAALTEKEYHLLLNLISLRSPCNLLVFGLEQQYLNLSRINAGGNTVFLEDNPEKLTTIKTNYNNTRFYSVVYQTLAGDAYKLLKNARQNPACGLQSAGSLKKTSCPLALTKLPREVYKRKWDVVVVDGPRGDAKDAPGRMAAIYTAGVIARAGNMTDVVVHDVDRTIEKWFAWEFLCDENLVSTKGKLWNFRIPGKSNSTAFCPTKTIQIE